MKVAQRFTVARPLAEVWAFFRDVPAVARCMPGAELTEDRGGGLYAGKVKARLGPFGANFEGEARVTADPASHSGHVEGQGVDRRGGSRTRMVMDYRLAPAGDGTEVTVDADVTLAGAIAQFGRTGLMQETANILVQDFVSALEAQLVSAGATSAAVPGATIAASRPGTQPAAPAAPSVAAAPQAAQPAEAVQRLQTPEPPALEAATVPEAAETTGPRTARPRQAPEPPHAPGPARAPEAAAAAKPQRVPGPATSKSVPRAIHAGSVGLRALWAWLKSLLRGLFFGSDKGH